MSGQAQFGDTSVIARVNRLKGEQGKLYRVQILDEQGWSENRHYVGKYVACLKEMGHCPACEWKQFTIKLSQIFGNNIVLYEVGMDGQVRTPLNPSIMLWTYGPKVWARLATLFNQMKMLATQQGTQMGLPQFERDLMITCENSKFQNWLVDLSFDLALTKAVSGLSEYVTQIANSKKVDLTKALCDRVTADEMQKLINIMPPPDGQQQSPGQASFGGRPAMATPNAVFGAGSPMAALPQAFPQAMLPAPMAPPVAPAFQQQMPQAPAPVSFQQPQTLVQTAAQGITFQQAPTAVFQQPAVQLQAPPQSFQPPQPTFQQPPQAFTAPAFGQTGNGQFPAPQTAEALAGNGMMSPNVEPDIPFEPAPRGPLSPPPPVAQAPVLMASPVIHPTVPAPQAAPAAPGMDDLVASLKARKGKTK